jgi:hypothetical protein
MTRHWQVAAVALVAALAALPRAATAQQREGRAGEASAAAVATYNAPRTMRVTGVLEVAKGQAIDGDVAVLNGPVTIAGRVTGTVVAINADVRLAPGASIGRDLVVVGGTISGRDGATIGGEVKVQAELLRYHFVEQAMVADDEVALDESWWKRRRRRTAVRSDDRSWRDLTFTSAHTYNRVEGLPILAGPRVHQVTSWGRFTFDAFGVVRTAGPVRWDRGTLGHDVATEVQLGRTLGVGAGGRLFDIVDGVEEWQMGSGEVGLAAFALHRDFQDYFLRHGAEGFVRLHGGRDADLTLSLGNERWQNVRARDPLSLLRNNDAWRPNPRMDEGTMHLATARVRVDTRRREGSPWRGWFLDATLERGSGTLARDPGLLTVIPRPEGVLYTRGFVDARRYNRLSPGASLNLRVVAGGWLSGDQLPMQRRLSVGGPATLPGYDFKRAWRVTPDVLTCGGTVLPGAPALCDRVMLLQAEFRRDFDLGWLRDDVREDWWRPGFNRHGAWVLFADAGRGWNVGRTNGSTTYSRNALPAFATLRTDIGAGIDFGVVGLYFAKATTTAREPMNVLFRVQHRF